MADKFKPCSIGGCNGNAHKIAKGARGWCTAHYSRWRRNGDPLGGRTPDGDPQRYFDEVVLTYEGDECLIWPFARTHGYGAMRFDGKMQYVSCLACEKEHGTRPTPEHEAAHSCGRGHLACVTKGHLSWKTHAGNEADKLAHDTHNRGERCNFAKLTEEDVRQIVAMKGTKSQRDIADRFGVHVTTVSKIHRKETWGWLEEAA